MPKPLTLSIVIPAYNEEGYLKACLDSIAAQTIRPDEVIVIDNNSMDKTAEIAQQYSFVKLIREERQGRVYARNAGFNLVKSDLIGRIDADTVLSPNWVENVKKTYAKAGSPKLYAATAPPAFRNRGWQTIWYILHLLTYFWPARLLLGHETLIGSNMFLTRNTWLRVKNSVCHRNDIHEDMDLALHAKTAGGQVELTKDLKASVLARKMHERTIEYPKMMLKIRAINHSRRFVPANGYSALE